jgi:hypothetical protein
LAFTAIAFPDERIRKLCLAAALVGASGLAVALIGSRIGPVAILVQGQAWRWVWITVLICVLMLPATILQVWRDEKCGSLCAILLVSGWTLAPVDGTACASLALIFWVMRTNMDPARVEVLGALPDYLTGTGFRVTPVVALVHPPFTVEADSLEVAEVFEVPLSFLMDPAHHEVRVFRWEGGERRFFAMPYPRGDAAGQYFVWGATAGMLRNFYRFLAA